MSTTTVPAPAASVRALDLLAAEWIKIRSVRSTSLTLLAAAVVTFGIGVFATSRAGSDAGAFFDPVETSLTGAVVAQLAFGVFGVLSITSEYTTGTIGATFAAAPRRGAVLAAKAAVTGAVALVAGEAIALVSFLLGQWELSHRHLDSSFTDPGVPRAVLGAGLYMCFMTLVGLGLGAVIRHTAGATAAVGFLFVEPLLVLPGFPGWAAHSVLWWAGQAVMSARPRGSSYLSAGDAFGVCCAYPAAALGAAAALINRRDA